MQRPRRPAGSAPTAASLHEAALAHLARFATTRANLIRVLERRIGRWARAAEAEGAETAASVAEAKAAARAVVARLVESGAVDDAAYAAGRARTLTRAGRSGRAVAAHLGARGVDAVTARKALPDQPEAELAAALVLARRRRIGPFRATEADALARRRELGILSRAGFPQEIAARALAMEREEAEDRIIALRR